MRNRNIAEYQKPCIFAWPDINMRGVGRIIFSTVMTLSWVCITVLNSPNPSCVYIRLIVFRLLVASSFAKEVTDFSNKSSRHVSLVICAY